MRAITFLAAMVACGGVLVFAGCSYEHPGPQPPEDNNPSPAPTTPVTTTAPVTATPPLPSSSPSRSTVASSKSRSTQPLTQTQTEASSPAQMEVQTETPMKPAASHGKPVTPNDIFPGAAAYEHDNEAMPASASPLATLPDAGISGGASDEANTSGTPGDISGFDNLELTDASLKENLTILRVGSEPGPNNLLSVFVGLKNKTGHQLDLEMQTLYKDKSGNALNTGSWVPMSLKPHEETEYRSASISADATDFVVRIRRAAASDSESPN